MFITLQGVSNGLGSYGIGLVGVQLMLKVWSGQPCVGTHCVELRAIPLCNMRFIYPNMSFPHSLLNLLDGRPIAS